MNQYRRYIVQTKRNDGRRHMWGFVHAFDSRTEAVIKADDIRSVYGSSMSVRVIEWSPTKFRVVVVSAIAAIVCWILMALMVAFPAFGSEFLTEFVALALFSAVFFIVSVVWFCADGDSALLSGDCR